MHLVSRSARSLLGSSRRSGHALLCAVLTAILFNVTQVFCLQAVSPEPVPWFRLFWLYHVVTVLASLPITVAGTGVREGASMVLLAQYGIGAPTAVAGAMLLDGDLEQCRRRVHAWFGRRLQELSVAAVAKDAKTQLQEFLQGRNFPLPQYELISVQGDDHAQRFQVACRLQKPQLVVEADGSSRRKAEQNAAIEALARLSEHGR